MLIGHRIPKADNPNATPVWPVGARSRIWTVPWVKGVISLSIKIGCIWCNTIYMFPYIQNLLHWNIKIRVPTLTQSMHLYLTILPRKLYSFPLNSLKLSSVMSVSSFSGAKRVNRNHCANHNLLPSSLYTARVMLWKTRFQLMHGIRSAE